MTACARTKEFEFNYTCGNQNEKVKISVPIPLSINIQELGSCLISQKKIPFFVEKGIICFKLTTFHCKDLIKIKVLKMIALIE